MVNSLLFWLLTTLLLTTVSPSLAQPQVRIAKIGFLSVGSMTQNSGMELFRRELPALGQVEGKSVAIEHRWANNQLDRLPALAEELVRLKVDVLVTPGTRELRALQKVAKSIPLVSLNLGDPVATGLVASLARPGGNITGFIPLSEELTGKRIELLKETVPKISRVAVLLQPRAANSDNWREAWKELQGLAPRLGVEVQSYEITAASELDGKFKDMAKARVQAVAVNLSPLLISSQKRLAEIIATHRLPAILPRADFAESGGLMSYGGDRQEPFRRVAVMVDKILKGTKPADIPVEQASKFDFVVNLRSAKQIGLTIPPEVLARANRIIK